MKKIIILSILLVSSSQLLFGKMKSVITHQENTLNIKTIVARWNKKKSRVILYFFPYQLTDEEIKKVKKGHDFLVIMDKKSPGPHWKQPVYTKLEIELKDYREINGFESIYYLYWNFIWFTGKNRTSFSSVPGSNLDRALFKHFKCILNSEGIIELQYKGKVILNEQSYEWDIDLKKTFQLE